MLDTLEDVKFLSVPQNSIIFSISLISTIDGVPKAIFIGGNGESKQFIMTPEPTDVLFLVNDYLNRFDEENPELNIIEICSDDITELVNLELAKRRIKPPRYEDFNLGDAMFFLSNPDYAIDVLRIGFDN